jgi:hypothetical protein
MNILLAEFASPETLVCAGKAARKADFEIIDAFTPFPVPEMADILPPDGRGIRFIMLAGGILIAGACYLLEWWTAVIAYPFNAGGRALHSWPVFFLVPFEFGVLGAAVCGLAVLFFRTGLPKLHDALFESDLIGRANADGFLLAVSRPEAQDRRDAARALLVEMGAAAVREVAL